MYKQGKKEGASGQKLKSFIFSDLGLSIFCLYRSLHCTNTHVSDPINLVILNLIFFKLNSSLTLSDSENLT